MNERILLSQPYFQSTTRTTSDVNRRAVSVAEKPLAVIRSRRLIRPSGEYAHSLATRPLMQGGWALLVWMLVWIIGLPAQAQTTTVDLSVSQTISNQKPAPGDVLTYVVTVRNAAGSGTATNVVINNQLPTEGVTYVPSSASVLRGAGGYADATGQWTISAVSPGDSAVLTFKATVKERGVWFNNAEVIAVDQPDTDSSPNNHTLFEDDYAAICFSVPIYWYAGDAFTVSIPSGYSQVVWYRNDTDVRTGSADLAVVNADSSLTIKSPGTYRFTISNNGCPSLNCCNIEVIQGPFGRLGDYVFLDTNKDGQQNDGTTGLSGVRVYLYNAAGTTRIDSTLTAGGGKYEFTGLPGGQYRLKFVVPDSLQNTLTNTGDDASDSDAGTDGLTPVYTIDASKPENDLARTNLTVDAGFISKATAVVAASTGLGDFVFYDNNGNGIQDGGSETGVEGVRVTLFQSTTAGATAITSTTTSATGAYSFTGLTAGASYYVVFDTTGLMAKGYIMTQSNATTDDATDSDAGADGKTTRTYQLTSGEVISTVDAGIKPLTASLGDLVFVDKDGNGQQAATGEEGVSGINVTLYKEGLSTPIVSQTTGTNGNYLFTGLTPGEGYYVVFDTTGLRNRGYTLTGANQGNDATDSDADNVTGKTASYTLTLGQSNLTVDAGLKSLCPTSFSVTVSDDVAICAGDSARLIATSTIAAEKICWYTAPTGGTALGKIASGAAFAVKPTTTTVYYAEAVTANGCASARVPVVVTVATVAAPVIVRNTRNTCPARTVDLTKISITNQNPNQTYEWYTSATRSQATRVTSLTGVGAGTYYLFARAADGCYSSPALLTADLVDCNCQNGIGVSVGPNLTSCATSPVTLTATLTGAATSVTWSANVAGTFSNPTSLTTTFTPSTTAVTGGSALITATTNDPDGPTGTCVAATSSLTLTISRRPEAPVGVASDDTTVCPGSDNKLIGFAPGNRINWYDQDNKLIGTTESGGKLVVRPTRPGINTYFAESVNAAGCTSATRTSVTMTVGSCLADLAVLKKAVTPGPYTVGQTVFYSVTISNKSAKAATQVKVTDRLPATLTFVGATPATDYNPTTGVWTVGTLAGGSDRNLLVQTTINSAGTITNTAIASSPENDPIFALNDTSSVTIRTGACDATPPRITASLTRLCKGDVTTLTATGCTSSTVVWSDGQRGLTISARPTVTTTYSASCLVAADCISAASNAITLTVTDPQPPTLVASAATVCPGASVTLTASGCTNGIYLWSVGQDSTASIVVSPTTRTTYTVQCRVANCVSTPTTKTIDIGINLPTPTITASTTVVCPGESVTLTANGCLGTPVWNSTTATTGSIVVTPTVGNNTYTVYCRIDGCTSPVSRPYVISVVEPVTPVIQASADSVCVNGVVSLTATGCNGTVVWSGSNGTSLTGAVIRVNPATNVSYSAQCRVRSCLSNPSEAIAITVLTPSVPIISASSRVVCSGDKITLTADGCEGIVRWNFDNRIGASIEVMPTETKEYRATCQVGSCESVPSTAIRVTVNTSGTAPTVTASITAVCSGGVVSLTATGCNGTVLWNVDGLTGPVISVTATPTNTMFYAVCRAGAQCASPRSNVINVTVTPTPTPTITASTTVACPGESVTLTVSNCQGAPVWSTGQTTSSIVVTPTVTTAYTVYCTAGACTSNTSQPYTITVVPIAVPTITASATAVESGGTVTLYAAGCAGEVFWSANGINGSNQGDSLVVRPVGVQSYYAQCKFRECLSEPSATLTINRGDCAADAGTLVAVSPVVCVSTSTTAVVAATPNGGLVVPTGYSTLYILTKGTDQVIQQTSARPTFTVSNELADYTIHTLVYNANANDRNYLDLSVIRPGITTGADVLRLIADRQVCADLDVAGAKVSVRSVAPPSIAASSLTVCVGTAVSLTATGCDGGTVNWSDGSVGQRIDKIVTSDLLISATCTLSGCISQPSQSLQIRVGSPGIPTVTSSSPTVCANESVTLTATGCPGGMYSWSDGQTTDGTLTVRPTADVSYRVKCKIGTCESPWSAAIPIKVGPPAAPAVSVAGSTTATVTSTTVCFGLPVTLTAQGCPSNSSVVWSNDQAGASITVTPVSSVSYTARCVISANCTSASSAAIIITVQPEVKRPTVVDRRNTCPFNTVDLITTVTSQTTTAGGVFEFYTDASLSAATKVANPAAVGTGTYYVVGKTTGGCFSLPAAVRTQIDSCTTQEPCDPNRPATASAGADATICAAKTYQLQGAIGGAGRRAYWTTNGTGTFNDPYSPTPIYTASSADATAGKVTLTLSVSTNNATCAVARDSMVLTIQGSGLVPVVQIIGSTNLCSGDSVILQAPGGAAGYRWSNNATTARIVVRESGAYNVLMLDGQGCSSLKSADITVRVAAPISAPLTTNIRNTCPAIVANLTSALSATTAGSTYEYRIGEAITSNRLVRPDSVGAGTFYVVERNRLGCVSAPARVIVRIVNCATDTLTADVNIKKTANKSVVPRGETVTYTITVNNTGRHTAYNVDVRDVLPTGLELVPGATPNYSLTNGIITKRIDSLPVGRSETIVFTARILTQGEIVNRADITYLDQRDPDLTNNTSSVTVRDTASYRPSLVGLAKSVVGTPTAEGDSLIKVRYRFVLTNYGDDTLRNVQVTDDLAFAFAPNRVAAVAITTTDSDFTLNRNSAFTGIGNNTRLFDSTSYVTPGRSQTFFLDVTIRRANGDTTRTFRNIAGVTASSRGVTIEDLSIDGGDPDPDNNGDPTNNTGFSIFTLGRTVNGPSIGVALTVVRVERQADGGYNVTYKATLKNNGNVALNGVSLTDSLVNVFTAPASYSVVGSPVVRAGSSLVANPAYNGSSQANLLTDASQLAVGVQDTVLFTVNVLPNGNNGPFYMNAVAQGRPPESTQTVRDVSNSGVDPTADGTVPTVVRFDLPQGLLGVAKSVGTPTRVESGVYDIPYSIRLRNAGSVPLSRVQVIDNLSQTFGSGALIVSNRISLSADAGLRVDTLYTGQGQVTRLLVDSLSTLPVGTSRSVNFTVRVNVRNATALTFNNRAIATAIAPGNVAVSDTSAAGLTDDPDNDLDPRNNSTPTPVTLENQATTPYIGVAKAVRDTVRQSDGSFNVTYSLVVRNYGTSVLRNVALTDTLTKVFNNQTGATYTIVRTPVTTSTGSTLKVNNQFNGNTDVRLVIGDSTSTMAVGRVDTVQFVVNVSTKGSTTTYFNSVYAQARANDATVTDVSTNGLVPDLNGNSNPTDQNEREATPLNLPPTASTVFIPEGFSPNGDGINDLFVIRGLGGVTISLEVYNRWGNLVYKNEDYRNDWDGKPNTGVQVGADANGLPDGTYYYVVRTSDNRQFVRYMTINR